MWTCFQAETLFRKAFAVRFGARSVQALLHQVSFCGRRWKGLQPVSDHAAEVLQGWCFGCRKQSTFLGWARRCSRSWIAVEGARVKGAGPWSAILVNESSGHLARSRKLVNFLFYLGGSPKSSRLGSYCQPPEISPCLLCWGDFRCFMNRWNPRFALVLHG